MSVSVALISHVLLFIGGEHVWCCLFWSHYKMFNYCGIWGNSVRASYVCLHACFSADISADLGDLSDVLMMTSVWDFHLLFEMLCAGVCKFFWLCMWWYVVSSVCMKKVYVGAMYRRSPCARGRVHFDFSEEVIRKLHAANHGHAHRSGRRDD